MPGHTYLYTMNTPLIKKPTKPKLKLKDIFKKNKTK